VNAVYRTSIVNEVLVNSVTSSSVFQSGDTEKIQSYSAVLAVQRESTFFGTFNLSFKDYDLFEQKVLVPLCPPVKVKKTFHAVPFIKVGKVDVIGVSSAAIFHIGSVHQILLQSRVKHIRNYMKNPFQNGEEGEA
jgi:spore germination protein PE